MEVMKQVKIKKGHAYAVQTGDFVGQMFIVCNIGKDNIGCLSVPDMKNVFVPIDKWDIGRNSGIIEYVEDIKGDVLKVCKAQYEKNENSNN